MINDEDKLRFFILVSRHCSCSADFRRIWFSLCGAALLAVFSRRMRHPCPAPHPPGTCVVVNAMQMKDYYSMLVCTPARASLMTGRYVVRYGLQYKVIGTSQPWGLPTTEKVRKLRNGDRRDAAPSAKEAPWT